MLFRFSLIILVFVLFSCTKKTVPAKSETGTDLLKESTFTSRIWKNTPGNISPPLCQGKIYPLRYRLLDVDTSLLKNLLIKQGSEPGKINTDTILIDIPFPDGSWESFSISQVQVMAPELAAKYPYLKTYSGNSKLYPADQIRIEATPDGLRVMVLSVKGTVLIDPFCDNDKGHMISYLKRDMPEGAKEEFEKK